MSAGDALGRQFSFTPAGDGRPEHDLRVSVDGTEVGGMSWHPRNGMVMGIHVTRDHQRQGHATALWEQGRAAAARTGVTPPIHSDVQTAAGRAWAHSLGRGMGAAKVVKKKPKGDVQGEALF